MKWWKIVPGELSLAKVVATLTVLMVAYLLLVPHQVWQGVVALATVGMGIGTTTWIVVVWRRRGTQ